MEVEKRKLTQQELPGIFLMTSNKEEGGMEVTY